MEMVLATHHFAGFNGSETYLMTVAAQLQRQGHEVTIYALEHGRIGEVAREQGLRLAASEDELPAAPDAVLAQDAAVSYDLAARYPEVPQLYVCHAETFDLSTPPQLPGVTSALVVLHDRVGRWAKGLALDQEIVRLSQPVDLDRFCPRAVTRERPRTVLALGNYLRGPRREMVASVCAGLGLELRVAGALSAHSERPEEEMRGADIVIGKARVIVEAMACGRAAYVLDHNGGDGWVTPAGYATLEADNFGGQAGDDIIDAERLRRDLAAYSPEMGVANRDLAVRHHSAIAHATGLVDALRMLKPRSEASAEPARELARLVRVQWHSEQRAERFAFEIERLRGELEDSAHRYDDLVAEHRRLHAEHDACVAERPAMLKEIGELQQWTQNLEHRVAYLNGIEAEIEALRKTRRFKLVAALARPLDRLRR